jgi:magnesium transporter
VSGRCAVWDGMRGSTFDSAIVVAVCTNGRLVGLASIELLLAAPADAVLADVMDIDAPVVAPGTASGAGRMASVEAGGTRSRGGQRIQPLPSPNPPQRLDGILLREHDEDLDRLGRFLASTPDARTASQETVGRRLWHRMPWLAVGLAGAMASAGPLAGIEDQMATNLAGPTSSSGSCTWPMRSAPRRDPGDPRLIRGRRDRPHRPPRGALTGLLVGCLLAAAMLPLISWLWHDPARRRRQHPD